MAEELEVLHGAYYEEQEHSANHQQRDASPSGINSTLPDPGPFPGTMELDKNNSAASPASAIGNSRNRNQRQTQQVGRMQREGASMDVEDEDEEVFTTFAARMFEQLLQAYREKLTQEQQLLLKKAAEGVVVEAGQATSEEENKMGEECAKHEVVSQAQEEERDVVLIIYSDADDCQGWRFLCQCQPIPTNTP